MTSRLLLLTLMSPLTAVTLAQAPRDRVAVAPNAGRIAGTVVSAASEPKPLRRARVTLNGPPLQPGRTAITGDDGTFAFDGLPPGQYSLAAVKSGYIAMEFGASGPGRPGSTVMLDPGGQRVIAIGLPKGSAITGMVTDPEGQPLSGLQVTALTYRITPPSGERRFLPAQVASVVSDDRGIYRIHGLPAGEYGVVVRPRAGPEGQMLGVLTMTTAEVKQALAEVRQPRDRRILPPPPPTKTAATAPQPGRTVALAPVFYPGTTHASQARLVRLGPGEERSNVDVPVDYVPVARIAGSVIATGAAGTRGFVRLVPATENGLVDQSAFRNAATDADGMFAFDRVTPGRYLVATRASLYGSTQVGYESQVHLWASTEVAVDGVDITNLVLTPTPGSSLSGRLVFQGTRRAPDLTRFGGLGLPLTPAVSLGGDPVVLFGPDGRFTIHSVPPGILWPAVTTGIRVPMGPWWLKSITVDGREALDTPLVFRTSADNVVVTFAETASELNGRVADATGAAAANCMVVVFPVNSASWFFNSRRIAAVRPDILGRYTIKNLPAGDYLVVARDDLDALQWFNPETLQQLVPAAARIRIGEDQQVTHDIMVASR